MVKVSVALWMPVSGPNFYSVSTNGDLFESEASSSVRSTKLDQTGYEIRLRVTVLRRVLEVLPRSYGYEPNGQCVTATDPGEQPRPVKVTMTLRPKRVEDGQSLESRANAALCDVGADTVTFSVDEDGFYTWTAVGDEADEVSLRLALRAHACQVIGGAFSLERDQRSRQDAARAKAGIYNGKAGAGAEQGQSRPLGILTYFQLNTMMEGLFNETLTPAVFFENYTFIEQWKISRGRDDKDFRSIGELAGLLLVETDATVPAGRAMALARFLAVTSRESLLKLTWSVESVRRALLDSMLGVLHRQSRLNQLRLNSSELTPQLAANATETQLRGYVIVTGAKLPLIVHVSSLAGAAFDRLNTPAAGTGAQPGRLPELSRQIDDWNGLLATLIEDVKGLERAIEQAWMERLLNEQEQVRDEQEATTEIERSRSGRAPVVSFDTAINSLALIITIGAVLWSVTTQNLGSGASGPWWTQLRSLLPTLVIGLGVYLAVIGSVKVYQRLTEPVGGRLAHSYEFAFRLNQSVDANRVATYLSGRRPIPVRSERLRRLRIARLGGGRLEHESADKTTVKLHSSITFATGPFSRAYFEVVNEIVAHRVSDTTRYVLQGTRVFGECQRPLQPADIYELGRLILVNTAAEMLDTTRTHEGDLFQPDHYLELAMPLYRPTGPTPAVGRV